MSGATIHSGPLGDGDTAVTKTYNDHDLTGRAYYVCVLVTQSCLTLCKPMDLAHQAPLSMGFSRQECWSRMPCPCPEDLPKPGIEPVSLTSLALAGRFLTTSANWEAQLLV